MLWAAERTLVRGQALAHQGVWVNGHGVIEAVGPLAATDKPTHRWPNELLVPGWVDVWAQDLWNCAQEIQVGRKPTYAITQAFESRLQQGITCVGVPHRPSARYAENGWGAPFAEAEIIMAAAQAVGLRVALIDTLALRPNSAGATLGDALAPNLNTAIGAFEQLVHRMLAQQDSRLSWAMAAPLGPLLPMDALVGLRLRLSHLPCIVQPEGQNLDEAARALMRANLLDSCLTLMDTQGMTRESAALLPRFGATHLMGAAAIKQSFNAGGKVEAPNAAAALMSHQQAENVGRLPCLPSDAVRSEHSAPIWLNAASAGGIRALGLRGGRLAPNSWADAFTVSLSDVALRAQCPTSLPPERAIPMVLCAVSDTVKPRRTLVAGRQVATHPSKHA